MSKNNLLVLGQTKELIALSWNYIEKFPKKQQFLIGAEIKKLNHQIYQALFLANQERVWKQSQVNQEKLQRRHDKQDRALAYLSLLDFYIELSSQNHWISLKNQQTWSYQVLAVIKLTQAWIKSDQRRFSHDYD